MGWTGDPTWLEEVLREALGERLVVHEGWQNCGTGDGEGGSRQMGPIWGVLIHHTANVHETPENIRKGVWQLQPNGQKKLLPGPLSQGLITPDGRFHLVAIGPCNHAGVGRFPGVGENKQGNTRLIGIECAHKDGAWPRAQMMTMRDATAAILAKLGNDSSHVIGHKEWAPERKPDDPGNMDMDWFRGEVAKALNGEFKQFDKKTTSLGGESAPPSPL